MPSSFPVPSSSSSFPWSGNGERTRAMLIPLIFAFCSTTSQRGARLHHQTELLHLLVAGGSASVLGHLLPFALVLCICDTHDFAEVGVPPRRLAQWLVQVGWSDPGGLAGRWRRLQSSSTLDFSKGLNLLGLLSHLVSMWWLFALLLLLFYGTRISCMVHYNTSHYNTSS